MKRKNQNPLTFSPHNAIMNPQEYIKPAPPWRRKERRFPVMWVADNWKDYQVIDCSGKEKLERWGDYTLIRPDPQIIWNTSKSHPGWKHPNAHYHRSSKGGGQWEFFDLPDQWTISYKELIFQLKPFHFKHHYAFIFRRNS